MSNLLFPSQIAQGVLELQFRFCLTISRLSDEKRLRSLDLAVLGVLDIAGLGALAMAARTFNLGTFSFWLDEILLLTGSRGGLAEVWAASRASAEHPPLAALATAALSAAGLPDDLQRLLPIGLGVATVLLLASWAARGFGRAAGLATGLVAALLPFHVRYSQELRPYVYLLFFAALTLWAAGRLERRPTPGAAALVFAACLGGFYSHLFFALVLVPAAWKLAEAALARSPDGRRALGLFALAAGTALLAFLPWILAVSETLASRPPAGGARQHWGWGFLLGRWQFLTAGSVEGERLTWAGALALLLALAGAGWALRSPAGRAAVAGAVLGIAVPEAALAAAGHWSNGRYDAAGWLFLPVLIGLGIARLGALPHGRLPAMALLAALLVGEASGLARYARNGRPDWNRVAETVRRLRRPGEPVFAENDWTRISLAYYLQGRDWEDRTGEDGAPVAVSGGPRLLRRLWLADRSALLVVSGFPKQLQLRRWARAFPVAGRFPRCQARVFRLTPEIRRRLFDSGIRAAGPAAPP